jgi:sulfopropanediol 3-dehydrogenase
MADYLKHTPMYSRQVTDAVRATVSEMPERIERDGEDAIRHYSRELDGWDPPSFVVDADDVEAASSSLTPELRDHIAFAQEQVRTFAAAQRASLTDIEIETRPGVVLGHRHIPVAAVGSYVPGGRYPMLASAFMPVVVPNVAGVDRVVAVAPPRGDRAGRPATRDLANGGGRRRGVA